MASMLSWFGTSRELLRESENARELLDHIRIRVSREDWTVSEIDYDRPWGGFVVLAERDAQAFAQQFFEGTELVSQAASGTLRLTPKFLVVSPHEELSWQYHHRRSEGWRVVVGPVAVYRSLNNAIPKKGETLGAGELIRIACEQRHRLVGTDGFGVVAEMWLHKNPEEPSDENDVVRLLDKYGRET